MYVVCSFGKDQMTVAMWFYFLSAILFMCLYHAVLVTIVL
jgi:hypothetical protein